MEVVLQKGEAKVCTCVREKAVANFSFIFFSSFFKPTLHVLFIVMNIIIIIGQNGTTIFVRCTIPFFSFSYSVFSLWVNI